MSKSCVKLFYGFATLHRGRGEILNTLFKIPWYFVNDCLKFTNWKGKWGSMPAILQNSNVLSWTWLCYGALSHEHSDIRRCQNGRKNAAMLFLSYYYLALVGKELLQAHNDKCCSLLKLLCIYFCYFILLYHG